MISKKDNQIKKALIKILQVGDEIQVLDKWTNYKDKAKIIKVTKTKIYFEINHSDWIGITSTRQIPKSKISYQDGLLYFNRDKTYFVDVNVDL